MRYLPGARMLRAESAQVAGRSWAPALRSQRSAATKVSMEYDYDVVIVGCGVGGALSLSSLLAQRRLCAFVCMVCVFVHTCGSLLWRVPGLVERGGGGAAGKAAVPATVSMSASGCRV